jgi:hypothetical protein
MDLKPGNTEEFVSREHSMFNGSSARGRREWRPSELWDGRPQGKKAWTERVSECIKSNPEMKAVFDGVLPEYTESNLIVIDQALAVTAVKTRLRKEGVTAARIHLAVQEGGKHYPTPLESDAVNEEMVAQANQNLGETMRDLRNYLLTTVEGEALNTMRATDASEVWEIQKILSGSQEMRIEEDPDDLERNIREGKFMCDTVDGRSVYRKMTDEDSLKDTSEALKVLKQKLFQVLEQGGDSVYTGKKDCDGGHELIGSLQFLKKSQLHRIIWDGLPESWNGFKIDAAAAGGDTIRNLAKTDAGIAPIWKRMVLRETELFKQGDRQRISALAAGLSAPTEEKSSRPKKDCFKWLKGNCKNRGCNYLHDPVKKGTDKKSFSNRGGDEPEWTCGSCTLPNFMSREKCRRFGCNGKKTDKKVDGSEPTQLHANAAQLQGGPCSAEEMALLAAYREGKSDEQHRLDSRWQMDALSLVAVAVAIDDDEEDLTAMQLAEQQLAEQQTDECVDDDETDGVIVACVTHVAFTCIEGENEHEPTAMEMAESLLLLPLTSPIESESQEDVTPGRVPAVETAPADVIDEVANSSVLAMPATMTRVLDPGEIIHANQAHLAVHKATAGQDQEFMNCDSCAVQNLVSAKKFFMSLTTQNKTYEVLGVNPGGESMRVTQAGILVLLKLEKDGTKRVIVTKGYYNGALRFNLIATGPNGIGKDKLSFVDNYGEKGEPVLWDRETGDMVWLTRKLGLPGFFAIALPDEQKRNAVDEVLRRSKRAGSSDLIPMTILLAAEKPGEFEVAPALPALTMTPNHMKKIIKAQRKVTKVQDRQIQTMYALGMGEMGNAQMLHSIFNHAHGRQVVETISNKRNFFNVPDEFDYKRTKVMIKFPFTKRCAACAFANARVDPHYTSVSTKKYPITDALGLRVTLCKETVLYFDKTMPGQKIRPFQILVADASTGFTPSRSGSTGEWTVRCVSTGTAFYLPYKLRTDIYDYFPRLVNMIMHRYGYRVRCLRVDRIGEQVGARMQSICDEKDVILDKGSPQDSKTMAKAENLNLRVDRAIRVTLASGLIPEEEWDICGKEVVRKMEMMGIKTRGWDSPLTLSTGRPRDWVDMAMYPWGAVVAVKLSVPSGGKQKIKMTLGLFAGRENQNSNDESSIMVYRPKFFRAAGTLAVRSANRRKCVVLGKLFDPVVALAVMKGGGRDILHDMYTLGDTSKKQVMALQGIMDDMEGHDNHHYRMPAYKPELRQVQQLMQGEDETVQEVEQDEFASDQLLLSDESEDSENEQPLLAGARAQQQVDDESDEEHSRRPRRSARPPKSTTSRIVPGGDHRRYTDSGKLRRGEIRRRESLHLRGKTDLEQSPSKANDESDATEANSDGDDRDTDHLQQVEVEPPSEKLIAQVVQLLEEGALFGEIWDRFESGSAHEESITAMATMMQLTEKLGASSKMHRLFAQAAATSASPAADEKEAAIDFVNTPMCFDQALVRSDWWEWVLAYREERGNLEPTVVKRKIWEASAAGAKVHSTVTVSKDKQNADTGEREKRKIRGAFNGAGMSKNLKLADVYAAGVAIPGIQLFWALLTKVPIAQEVVACDYKGAFLQTKDCAQIKSAAPMFMYQFEWWDRCMQTKDELLREREKLLRDMEKGILPDPKAQYRQSKNPDTDILQLLAYVYGHPEAGKVWGELLATQLSKWGFNETKKCPGWFHLPTTGVKVETLHNGDVIQRPNNWPGQEKGIGGADVIVYVDDLQATFEQKAAETRFFEQNDGVFKATRTSPNSIIGMRTTRKNVEIDGVNMIQCTMDGVVFTQKLLEKYEYVGYKKLRKVLTPAIEGVMRTDSDACDPLDPDMVALCAAYPFRSIVCSLMWLRIVRKDINWAVWHCTLHLHNYGPSMIDDCNRILRCLLERNPEYALCWTGDGSPGVLNAEGDHDASISSVIDDRSSVIASIYIYGDHVCVVHR